MMQTKPVYDQKRHIALVLSLSIAGKNPWAIGLKEIIVRAHNQGANDIRIMMSGEQLLVADNGRGMTEREIGLSRSLGYPLFDGAHLLGDNICLALGDVQQTCIDIVTTQDGKIFRHFHKNYSYFCDLAEDKFDGILFKLVPEPTNWCEPISRTTGTNIFLSNCDIPPMGRLVQQLRAHLPYDLAKMTQVYHNNRWVTCLD